MLISKKIKLHRIGFVIKSVENLTETQASTRLRCTNIINYLKSNSINAEIYNSEKSYDVVIFQKAFDQSNIDLATELNSKNCVTMLDINVNYIEKLGDTGSFVTDEQLKKMHEMLRIVRHVIVSSDYLKLAYSRYHDSVTTIEEAIEDVFFTYQKKHEFKSTTNLLYCGYAIKANEIFLIKDILLKLNSKYKLKMIFVCDYDPQIDFLEYEFIKYEQSSLPEFLLKGDIGLAPRGLSNSYNLGHSFTKAAYPMSVGIPVVASPVPSYLNRNVLICHNSEEWHDTLELLITNIDFRASKGELAKKFVQDNFSIKKIGQQYLNLFSEIQIKG